MYGSGLIKGLGITLRHWFGKNIVVQYPEVQPHLEDRFRGCLQMDFAKCIACETCVRICPNGALKLEAVKDEKTKKKKLMKYTIDVQYCMFCGLCMESCPMGCLSFNHNFELAKYNREDIAVVYNRPPEMDAADENDAAAAAEEEAKKQKKLLALKTAMLKNPAKALVKVLEDEEQRNVMAELIAADNTKADKLVELMMDDTEKAKKVALAFVMKEMKARKKAAEEAAAPEGGAQ